MPTRQATPGASTAPVLLPSQSNARKRGVSESEGVAETSPKKFKAEAHKDKKKRRKKKRKTSIVALAVSSPSESKTKLKSAPDVAVASSSSQTSPSTPLTLVENAGAVYPVGAIGPSIVSHMYSISPYCLFISRSLL